MGDAELLGLKPPDLDHMRRAAECAIEAYDAGNCAVGVGITLGDERSGRYQRVNQSRGYIHRAYVSVIDIKIDQLQLCLKFFDQPFSADAPVCSNPGNVR